MKTNKKINRRDLILSAAFGSGAIGLRSLLTGLPIHFLTSRSMANTTGKYLVYCARRAGDPVNNNVPGTYVEDYAHSDAFSTPVDIRLGTETFKAASAWNLLSNEIKASANFFHLRTTTNSHNELESVMKIFGAVEPIEGRAAEMLPSVIAHEHSQLLGTQLTHPIALQGILSYKGRNQKIYSPQNIKSLFPSGLSTAMLDARAFRDRQIDSIYRDVKTNGTPAQRRFMDDYVVSGQKARDLGNQLSQELATVNGNSQADQMRTAAALLALKVTPSVIVGLDFGGDNHGDATLSNETAKHNSSIQDINILFESLKSYGIQDQTIFAMLNVFGRTPWRNSRGGRDHHGRQSIMFSFGSSIKPGMVGDIRKGDRNRYEAQGINSQTGRIDNPDIDPNQTLHSAAKSLIAATGLSEAKINTLVTGGKVVRGFLK